jgi:type II secretory pathway component GspD/PulD (secretin)
MKILALAIFAFMLAVENAPESNIDVNPKLAVEFQNERLSVHAEEVPLQEILGEIGEKSGINFVLRDEKAAANVITLDLKDLAPARALEEILRGLNFAYFYSGTRLARVVILPQGVGMIGSGGRAPSLGGSRDRLPGATKLKPKAEAIKKTPEQIKEESRVTSKLDAIDDLENKNDPKSIAALAEML